MNSRQLIRQGKAHRGRCVYTTVPRSTVEMMAEFRGRYRPPDGHVGTKVAPWCWKCGAAGVENLKQRGDRFLAQTEVTPEARLADTVAAWLADKRPIWETIDAFERDVEKVLRGMVTRSPGMPLRPGLYR